MLYVDEAHAFGVCGPRGLGLVAASQAPGEVDVVIGTFGKAAGSMGAFAITSDAVRQYLVNTSRPLIFSTALPPMQAAWTRFALSALLRPNAAGRIFSGWQRDSTRCSASTLPCR